MLTLSYKKSGVIKLYHVSFDGLSIELEVNPVCFSIGNFEVKWYGVLIATGMLLAMLYAYFNAHRFGVDRENLFDCVLVGVITAAIGARLYYVIFNFEEFAANPMDIFDIRGGGLAIYGGIIGALIGGLTVAKIKKMKFLPILDVTMLGFLIGQGIGRWGNFTNQEAFGAQTDSLFRMTSENTVIDGVQVAVHPCFLYESVWCLLGFVLLHLFSKKFQKYNGQIFYLYLVWYGFERMIVEGLRTDSLYLPFSLFGYTPRVSQVLSAVILIVGIVMLIINRKNTNMIRLEKPISKKKQKLAKAENASIKNNTKTGEDGNGNNN